jgi:hypothetical protein
MARLGIVLKYKINVLARLFYASMGYSVEEGYDFSTARHPTEKMVWNMAKASYDYWSQVLK